MINMSTNINHLRNYKYRRLSKDETEVSGVADDSDGEHENLELQRRELNKRSNKHKKSGGSNSSTPEKDIILVDKPIVAGESLASISLKYRISISELKRVNKIQKDIEFYALSNVKIPVRTNSALLDILNDEMQVAQPTPSNSNENGTSVLEPLNNKHIEAVKSSLAKARNLHDKVDIPQGNRKSHNIRLYSTAEDKVLSTCSGADWDLSWWTVLVIGIMLFLGLPLLYYFFYTGNEN